MSDVVCPKCGYRAQFDYTVTGIVNATMVMGCPSCGTEMFADDPLGQIERDSREPRNLRDIVGDKEGLMFLPEDDAA